MVGPMVDRISYLDEETKRKILTFLPIKDAGKTAILSSNWRHTWAPIEELKISDDDCYSCGASTRTMKRRVKQLVDRVFLAHPAPIRKFELSTSIYSAEAFDRWVRRLSTGDILFLTLDLKCRLLYKVNSNLFSCETLTSLYLCRCWIKQLPTGFQGFKRLVFLTLERCRTSGKVVKNLVSSSPLLERLVLKKLRPVVINIDAVNLKWFRIEDSFKYLRVNAPKLVTMVINLHVISKGYRKTSNLVQALGNVPNLQYLEMISYSLAYLAREPICGEPPITLSTLKEMNLIVALQNKNESTVLLMLLRSAPNLRKVNIEANLESKQDDVSGFWAFEETKDCCFEHLEIVIVDLWVSDISLAFVEFILRSTPQLRELIIFERKPGDLKDQQFTSQLYRFYRASGNAEIYVIAANFRRNSIM